MTVSHDLLRLKLAESLAYRSASLIQRDIREPAVAGKALAVIGVRRSGKTSFMAHRREELIVGGRPPESQLLVTLEDDRLAGMDVADLAWLLDEHARRYPSLADARSLYLDEVQVVPGWEAVVRRLMDGGGVAIHVSGSSAKLLSREVATSLRGRAMEVLVHPFSFREALRYADREPPTPYEDLAPAARATLDEDLRRYMGAGGFPEAQGLMPMDRAALLRGYVDVVVLRDVIERHAVSNPVALRWLERQLLSQPGGMLSINKQHQTLRGQGIPVGKDAIHAYFGYLDDAFLVRSIWMHSASERQRMANPRKVYPVDSGLIALFERSGRQHRGLALETVVLLELERRGYDISYVRTPSGAEVDFLAHRAGDDPLLIQVSLETEGDATWDRELRALVEATPMFPDARALLITADAVTPMRPLPERVSWMPAVAWLLADS
jgi:predicted AAA+ superfamily ATPase